MARTHSRKISRRTIKKKSPIPAVLVVLYMAGLAICYVIIQIQNKELSYTLDSKKKESVERRNRIRNLNAEVEKYTAKRFIEAKVRQFNLGLREPEAAIKQVYQVTHFEKNENGLTPQALKQVEKVETVTKR